MANRRNAKLSDKLAVLELISDDWYELWEVFWQLNGDEDSSREILKNMIADGLIVVARKNHEYVQEIEETEVLRIIDSEIAFEPKNESCEYLVVGITEAGMREYELRWHAEVEGQ